jgi:hypothetical protein
VPYICYIISVYPQSTQNDLTSLLIIIINTIFSSLSNKYNWLPPDNSPIHHSSWCVIAFPSPIPVYRSFVRRPRILSATHQFIRCQYGPFYALLPDDVSPHRCKRQPVTLLNRAVSVRYIVVNIIMNVLRFVRDVISYIIWYYSQSVVTRLRHRCRPWRIRRFYFRWLRATAFNSFLWQSLHNVSRAVLVHETSDRPSRADSGLYIISPRMYCPILVRTCDCICYRNPLV